MEQNSSGGKRDDILRATLRLIKSHGFHGTPMSLIAQEAQVGAGTIYRYFKSKEDLIQQLYREIRLAADKAMLENYQAEVPVRERFMRVWKNLAKYFILNPDHLGFLDQFDLSPFPYQPDEEHQQLLQEIDQFLDYAREQQFMKDLSNTCLYALIFAPLRALCRLHHTGEMELSEDLMQLNAAACWDAVRR
ncbi:DNA-binding transcriptional regulator, AcrR family [Catalinimonas alkaloidigena]|uniref:DNA-binding transcriptional regulator, AcrR family n=1 Tax=Catalinimonas alkaloidigena TaxID=1075417 RepID=A0A1G9EXM5_9BACT|nr:TetR/AcrR family transcriptional regulator [Catalinimonas alkaloidigena]SDK80840.1 DNA-binding transcriptional regulator, AcrR family [Catalinimonas alkaloidigena]